MILQIVIYGALGLTIVATALGMLITKRAVYSVLFLVMNFATVAILYLILGAPFIAFAQITVYAGAIMVLFLFVIMMLGAEKLKIIEPLKNQRWIAIVLAVVFMLSVGAIVVGQLGPQFEISEVPADFGAPKDIGTVLLQEYSLPFLVISVILLVATIGAVVLTRDLPPDHTGMASDRLVTNTEPQEEN